MTLPEVEGYFSAPSGLNKCFPTIKTHIEQLNEGREAAGLPKDRALIVYKPEAGKDIAVGFKELLKQECPRGTTEISWEKQAREHAYTGLVIDCSQVTNLSSLKCFASDERWGTYTRVTPRPAWDVLKLGSGSLETVREDGKMHLRFLAFTNVHFRDGSCFESFVNEMGSGLKLHVDYLIVADAIFFSLTIADKFFSKFIYNQLLFAGVTETSGASSVQDVNAVDFIGLRWLD